MLAAHGSLSFGSMTARPSFDEIFAAFAMLAKSSVAFPLPSGCVVGLPVAFTEPIDLISIRSLCLCQMGRPTADVSLRAELSLSSEAMKFSILP